MEFRDGKFAVLGKHSNDDAHKSASQGAVDALFLELMAELIARGQKLSPSIHSPTRYAPRLFADHAKANGTKEDGFADAMGRLLSNGAIKEVEASKNGRIERTIAVAS